MTGDFTRQTFDRSKHYRGVVMQQGRVQLDADWNENLAIGSHLLQTLTRDVIGECGVPIHVDAFKIDVPAAIDPTNPDFTILAGPQGKGRMYVNGLLIETEGDTTYLAQPDWLSPPAGATLADLGPQPLPLNDGETRVDLVYVDVWPRPISAIEDPHIREVALGGPDTAERIKLIWQVKVKAGVGEDAKCNTPIGPSLGGGTAQLIVTTPPVPPDPCEPTAQGGYQGPDNRFYRIEVHQGGPLGTATFKWSRDNGSVVAAIEQFKSATEIVVKSLGRDDYLKFKTGDFVEVTDDATDLSGLPGTLGKVTVDEASRTLTMSISIPDAVRLATGRHPKVRRWDGGDAQVTTAAPIDLEAGLKVQFGPTSDDFRTGDYWTFAARVIDGTIDPDSIKNEPTRPMGVYHVFCNLALITWTRIGDTVTAQVQDCRLVFPPLTEIPTGEDCCTVSVGDGVTSHGDFSDIQSAIDSLDKGGRVCILPGEYRLNSIVALRDKADVIISGCGRQTRITAPGDEPAVVIEDSARIRLESLTLLGRSTRGVIVIDDCRLIDVFDCEIANIAAREDQPRPRPIVFPRSRAGGPAINVFDSLGVTIAENALFGLPALPLQAQIAAVDENRLTGGGVWVRDGSSQVEIHSNDISNGFGAGIMLGGLGPVEKPSERQTGVDNVRIVDNRISDMAGSGISTVLPPGDQRILSGVVSDLAIAENRIAACVTMAEDPFTNEIALGGIVLREVTQVRIHHNTITDNGAAANVEANGIFAFLCEGLEITDNSITDNGAAASSDPTKCIDFSALEPGTRANPRTETGATFTVFNAQGNLPKTTRIVRQSGVTGLDCGFKTEISLDATTSSVELTLVSFSSPGLLQAFNEDGSSAETVQMNPDRQPQTITLRGAAIKQVTISAPRDEILLQKLCVDAGGTAFQAGIAAIYAIGLDSLKAPGRGAATVERPSRLGEPIPAAIIHDNVVICPQGHALIAVGLGSMSIVDNTLVSRGVRRQPDLPALTGAETTPINTLIKLTSSVMVYDLGRPRDSVPSLDTEVRTHVTPDFTRTFRAATFAQQLLFPDGRVAFDGNQVTLRDLDIRTLILPSVPVLVLSFDDVSLHHNQINTEIPQALVLIDAAAGGATLRASNNRITELPLRALLSCYSFGRFNVTSENQTTHCLVARGGQVARTDNQQLITLLCERFGALLGGK